MKKIINLSLYFILIILFAQCTGYKPIFGTKNINLKIANHTLKGDNFLANNIYNNLKRLTSAKKNEQNIREIDISIDAARNKKALVKDSTGKIKEYKISISVNIKITDYFTDKLILEKTFSESTSYKVESNYSDTVATEERSVQNLLNNINQELLIGISENI